MASPAEEPAEEPPATTTDGSKVDEGAVPPPGAEVDDGGDAPKAKGPTVCGVCEAVASKYKCSRCYLPYCSIACNKLHQKDHPPDQPAGRTTEAPPDPPPEAPTGRPLPSNPFQVLDNSDKLAWLFRKYPNLPQQLLDIYSATEPPAEDPGKRIPASLQRGAPRRGTWSADKGLARGKAALRRARQLPGEAGEAVREYCTLILLLLGEDESGQDGAGAALRQQFAQQDVDVIRQLMEEEKGRS
ncbi:hypothetical protein CDD83_4037 [Cordyceps sp. RAO-2017]|nr:hypothetical protein CDD83_4037 [Cordyceps sp. RAO-2017]